MWWLSENPGRKLNCYCILAILIVEHPIGIDNFPFKCLGSDLTFHTHQGMLIFYYAVMMVASQKLCRKCTVPTES